MVDATPKLSQSLPSSPEWQPPSPPDNLSFDDGKPLESNRHRIAMNLLIQSLPQVKFARKTFGG